SGNVPAFLLRSGSLSVRGAKFAASLCHQKPISGRITGCMNDLFDKNRGPRSSEAARVAQRDAHDRRVIAIRGAREHNLKDIDVEIPRDRLVVFTGLSGSGKSSLAFDTIYAEGQRRYVESLS